jgi:hypothetical protein
VKFCVISTESGCKWLIESGVEEISFIASSQSFVYLQELREILV